MGRGGRWGMVRSAKGATDKKRLRNAEIDEAKNITFQDKSLLKLVYGWIPRSLTTQFWLIQDYRPRVIETMFTSSTPMKSTESIYLNGTNDELSIGSISF